MASSLSSSIDAYRFRGLDPAVRFGTASDRYAGWIGQIYAPSWADRISRRKKTVGGARFVEEVLPVDSVAEYFEHFDVLEIDYTYYVPLVTDDGEPSRTAFTLERHVEAAPPDARFLLKAPEAFAAPGVRRAGRYVSNPQYLNADAYQRRFLDPAVDVLGDRLAGVLVEQGYQRKASSPSPASFVAQVDRFFQAVDSRGVPHHIEVRSPHLLEGPLASWLAASEVGLVLSHWSFLPPLFRQWSIAGPGAASDSGEVVVRLLTPLGTRYADAYAQCHPFDRPVAEIAESPQAASMISDVAAIVRRARERGLVLIVVGNNRAWGNAPDLLRVVARAVVDTPEP